jgi:uncharacterized protein (DUF488 family)
VKQSIFTIGHSTRTIADFAALLREASIDRLADVRSIPRSRTNPQFNSETLAPVLAAEGVEYRHLKALGGLRHRRKDTPSPNTLWRNDSFRSYADYATTDVFRSGLDELLEFADAHRCAIMCAEAVWWRCHRRIIADYLLTAGFPVAHIMGHGKIEPAKLTPGAREMPTGTLLYQASMP